MEHGIGERRRALSNGFESIHHASKTWDGFSYRSNGPAGFLGDALDLIDPRSDFIRKPGQVVRGLSEVPRDFHGRDRHGNHRNRYDYRANLK